MKTKQPKKRISKPSKPSVAPSRSCAPLAGSLPVWEAKFGETAPVKASCERYGWPNRTDTGEVMYDNTHFPRERDAWEKLVRETDAALSLQTCSLISAREEVSTREKQVAASAVLRTQIAENFDKWRRAHLGPAENVPISDAVTDNANRTS